MRKIILLLSTSLVLCFSCEHAYKQETLFYPIDSLLNLQVKALAAANAELTKEAVIGTDSSVTSYALADTLRWRKELEVFFHIGSINKPVNKSLYSTTDSKDASGLLMRNFTTTKIEQPVRFLKIYYTDDPRMPQRIEARVEEKNSMFEGTRDLRLEFARRGDSVILSKYSIHGGQEMFLSDSVKYTIKGSITTGK